MQQNKQKLINIIKNICNILHDIPKTKQRYPLSESICDEIKENVMDVDKHVLRFYPKISHLSKTNVEIFCADVYQQYYKMNCNIFLLKNVGSKLPLHNHPEIDGFIRPITGKLLITSFSWLNSDEENFWMSQNEAIEARNAGILVRPARFDGTYLVDAEHPEVVTLSHRKGNVHSIEALEPVSSFFDVLIPGYGDNECIYYECNIPNPVVGKVYFLKIVPIYPVMSGIFYDTVHLNDVENNNLNIY